MTVGPQQCCKLDVFSSSMTRENSTVSIAALSWDNKQTLSTSFIAVTQYFNKPLYEVNKELSGNSLSINSHFNMIKSSSCINETSVMCVWASALVLLGIRPGVCIWLNKSFILFVTLDRPQKFSDSIIIKKRVRIWGRINKASQSSSKVTKATAT